MKRKDKKSWCSYHEYRPWDYHCLSIWSETKKTTRAYSIMEKNSMKNSMKIIYSSILVVCIFFAHIVGYATIGPIDQTEPWQFNYEYNRALIYEWEVKPQEKSGLPLFGEAREKVQAIKNTKEGIKTTEAIHNMWNDFCRWFYGTCDEKSIYARLIAWCETARDEAMKKMTNSFVKNNTALLLASYSSCYNLADNVVKSYKDAASVELAGWNKGKIEKSQNNFQEKSQNNFQEKVSNIWDVFKKKLTNFVRSIEGITRNVNLRW